MIKRDGTRKEEETYDDAFDAVVKIWLQHCLSGHVCGEGVREGDFSCLREDGEHPRETSESIRKPT